MLSKAETCARTHSTRAGTHAQLCTALTTKPAERSEVRLQGRPLEECQAIEGRGLDTTSSHW